MFDTRLMFKIILFKDQTENGRIKSIRIERKVEMLNHVLQETIFWGNQKKEEQ